MGGAASPTYTSKIEELVQQNDREGKAPTLGNFDDFLQSKKIIYFDPDDSYVTHLKEFIAVDAIQKSKFKIVFDPLFGAGTDFIQKTLGQDVIQIHGEADPTFGGLNPEPIAKNLAALKEAVVQNQADIGLATDGDADRIGAFDENGDFVNSHQIFSLLLKHNVSYRKLSGAIIKSVSTTELIRKICEDFNLPLTETPIGFKHISQELLNQDALMGGEESGGISLREHVHERDGVLNGLLLVEMMAVNQKSLSQLIQDMDDQYGKFYFERDDYYLTDEKIAEINSLADKQEIKEVGGIAVNRYNLMDGTKLYFDDESWLLIRASGTEPLLRVYAEGKSKQRVQELLAFAKKYFSLG